MQKPFQFTLRDEQKLKTSRPATAAATRLVESSPGGKFRAHPFPSHLFVDSATERQLEEQEYRKIRTRMRAKQLLRSASLPPTMKLRGAAQQSISSRSEDECPDNFIAEALVA